MGKTKRESKKQDQKEDEEKPARREWVHVELPKTAENLTADQLTTNQKHIFKKQIQKDYGHKYISKEELKQNKMPRSLSAAADELKELLKQKKMEKQKQKEKSSTK